MKETLQACEWVTSSPFTTDGQGAEFNVWHESSVPLTSNGGYEYSNTAFNESWTLNTIRNRLEMVEAELAKARKTIERLHRAMPWLLEDDNKEPSKA